MGPVGTGDWGLGLGLDNKMKIKKLFMIISLVSFTTHLSYLIYNKIAHRDVNTIKYSVRQKLILARIVVNIIKSS